MSKARSALRISRKTLLSMAVLGALGAVGLPQARAALIYWNGAGTGWDNTANWSTASGAATPNPGAVPGINDDAIFNITTVNTAQTVNLNANQSARSLTFNTGSVLLQGGGTSRTLTLGSGGITVNSGAGAVTIGSATAGQEVDILLDASQTWSNLVSSANSLTIRNNVSLANAGNQTLTLFGTNSGNNGLIVFNGVVSDGAGTLSLVKAGTTTTQFTVAPTHSGGTTVTGGVLAFRPTTAGTYAFGSGSITLDGGGTFGFNGNLSAGAGTFTLSNNFVVRNNGGGTIDIGRAANNPEDVFTGTVQLGGNLTLTAGAGGTAASGFQGTFSNTITITGADRWITNSNGSNNAGRITGNIVEDVSGRMLTLVAGAVGNNLQIAGTSNNWSGGTTIGSTGSAANSYISVAATSTLGTGTVQVASGGRLQINSASNVAGTGNIFVATGGILDIATISYATGLAEVDTASNGILRIPGAPASLDLNASGHSSLFVGTLGATNVTGTWTPHGGTYRIAGGFNGNMTFNTANVLSGTSNAIFGSFANNGSLSITADQNYSGSTTINRMTVPLTGASSSGRLSGTTAITVAGGGVLQNGSGTVAENTLARINGASSLTLGSSTLGGGTYTLGLTSTAGGFTQQHASLTVAPGLNVINTTGTGTTLARIQFTATSNQLSLQSGGVLNFSAGASGTFAVNFSTAPTLAGGILGGGYLVGYTSTANLTGDWATLDGSNNVVALNAPLETNTSISAWTSNANVYITSNSALSLTGGDKTINSLRYQGTGTGAAAFTIEATRTLTVTTGGVLMNIGNSGAFLTGGGTLYSPGDLYLYGPGNANQGARIDVQLKAGTTGGGNLILSGGGQADVGGGGNGAFALGRVNQFTDLYILSRTAVAEAPGSLGTGTVRLLGGGLSFNNVSQTTTNDVVIGSQQALIGAGNYVTELKGSLTLGGPLNIGPATNGSQSLAGTNVFNGVVFLNPGIGETVTGEGSINIITNGALAVSSAAALGSSNLNIANGVLVLDGRSSGNDIMNLSGLTTTRRYGLGLGQWQVSSGGFAARGATLNLDLSSQGSHFNRNFVLGSAARSADGTFFANASVNITQDILLSANRTITIAPTGGNAVGPAGQAVYNRISGSITGAYAPSFVSPLNSTNGAGYSEIILSGSNNAWTGSATYSGFSTGAGGLGNAVSNATGVYVRFDDTGLTSSQTSLPTGGGSAATGLVAVNAGNEGTGGFFFTGSNAGTTYYLSNAPISQPTRNLRMFIGSANNGNNRTGTIGSTGGHATIVGAPIVVLGQNGAASPNTGSINILVRDGTFTLGTAGANNQVTFIPGYNTGNVLPDFTGLLDVTSATRTIVTAGVGTVVLGNVAYTAKDLSTNTAGLFTWQVGASNYNGGGNNNTWGTSPTTAFGAAVREGSTASSDLSTVKVTLQGGVIEFASTPRSIVLGSGVGQVNMNGAGGGGFSAYGGARSLTISGGTLTWQASGSVAGFLMGTQALILGSTTADNTLTLTNDLALNNGTRSIATVRGTGSVPEGRLTGVISGAATSNSLIYTGMLRADGTPLATGTVEVTNTSNSYQGTTTITSGTVLAGGNAPGIAGTGVFGNSTTAILVGDTRNTLTAVRAASTGNVGGTFSAGVLSNVSWQAFDGVTVGVGDRVLLKNQSSQAQNGIYTVSIADGVLTLTRVSELDATGELTYGNQVQVTYGATQAGRTYYMSTTGAITINTTNNAWSLDPDQNVALLTNGAFTIGRNITVGGSTLGTATLGGNAAANSSFTGNVILNRDINLDQAAGGLVNFSTGTWTSNNKAVTVNNKTSATGTVQLSNTLSTTGLVTVKRGVFRVDGTLTGGGSNVVVDAGARLQGVGSIGKNTVVNGTYAPGNSIGTIDHLNTNLTLAGTAELEIDDVANTRDRSININALTYGGTLNVTNLGAGSGYYVGQQFDFFDFTSFSGTFSSISLPTLPGAFAWKMFSGSTFDYANGLIEVVSSGGTPAAFSITGTPGFGVLLNAGGGSVSGNVTVQNTGTLAGSASFSGVGGVLSSSDPVGSIAGGASNSSGFVSLNTTGYVTGSQNLSVSPAGANPTAAINYIVGEAIADDSNNRTNFNGTILVANVGNGGSYGSLASKVVGELGVSGGTQRLGSEAIIRDGWNLTNGASETVSMTWRTRTFSGAGNDEVLPGTTVPPMSTTTHGLISDIVRISGIDAGEIYSLQMSYDSSYTGSFAFLAWLNPNGDGLGDGISAAGLNDRWVNAGQAVAVKGISWVDGYAGSYAQFELAFGGMDGVFSSAELANFLGSWGYDASGKTVWAIVNYTGDFAVIPEPTSLSLLGLGAMGLLARRRRKA